MVNLEGLRTINNLYTAVKIPGHTVRRVDRVVRVLSVPVHGSAALADAIHGNAAGGVGQHADAVGAGAVHAVAAAKAAALHTGAVGVEGVACYADALWAAVAEVADGAVHAVAVVVCAVAEHASAHDYAVGGWGALADALP